MSTITKDAQRAVNLYCQGNTQGAFQVLKKYDKEPEIKSIFDRFQTEQGKPVLGNLSEPELAGKISAVLSGQAPAPEDEEMSTPETSTTTATSTCSAAGQEIAAINHCPEDVFQIIFSNSDLRVIILCRSVSRLWEKFATMFILCKVIPEKERYITCLLTALDIKHKIKPFDMQYPVYSNFLRDVCNGTQLTNTTSFTDLTTHVSAIQNYIAYLCANLGHIELKALQASLEKEKFSLFFNDIIFVIAVDREIQKIRSSKYFNNKSGQLTNVCLKLWGRKQFNTAIMTTKNEDISFSKTQALAVYTSIVSSLMDRQSINGDNIELVVEIFGILHEKYKEAETYQKNDIETFIKSNFMLLLTAGKFRQAAKILTIFQGIQLLKSLLMGHAVSELTRNNNIQALEEFIIAFDNAGDELKHEFLALCLIRLVQDQRLILLDKLEGNYSKIKAIAYLHRVEITPQLCKELATEIGNKFSDKDLDEAILEEICIKTTQKWYTTNLQLKNFLKHIPLATLLWKINFLSNVSIKLFEKKELKSACFIKATACEMAYEIADESERLKKIEEIKEIGMKFL